MFRWNFSKVIQMFVFKDDFNLCKLHLIGFTAIAEISVAKIVSKKQYFNKQIENQYKAQNK